MKKIVGIIAALALAGSVFARPDITPVITSFTGNAKVEWIADLDADTYGFANSTWTQLKIQTRSADWGGESTSGDGLWGELTLRTGPDVVKEYGTADVAKNIYDWPATGWHGSLVVTTAKVHFMDGDTYFNADILTPNFAVGEIEYLRALQNPGDDADTKFAGVNGFGYKGFTLNFGVPIVDLSFAFGDDGAKSFDAGHYGFKFAATLKPIDGLSLYAGVSKNTEENSDLGLAFTAAYNYKIDDQFYIKPALQFAMAGKKMDLGAAALFGWGDQKSSWSHDFLTFDKTDITVANNQSRASDGFSVLFIKPINDANGNAVDTSTLKVEFYDSKLLSGLDIGSVKIGAAYRAENTAELGKGAATFGLIYDNTIDIIYITAKASFGMNLGVDGDNNGFKWLLRLGTKEVIANTDLYAQYAAGYSKYSAADDKNKGSVTLGCQINF
jgi:hypothetical protein